MKAHHLAWLKAHPERTAAWLGQAFEQGFEVHHLDENHDNDHPENLVLIEHTDHFKIHHNWETTENSGVRKAPIGHWLSSEELEARIAGKLAKGEKAYRLKVEAPEKTWKQIGFEIGYDGKRVVMKTIAIAKQWALYHGKKWPLGRR